MAIDLKQKSGKINNQGHKDKEGAVLDGR